MALWDDFVNNIRRSVDQINPWDGGRNWNTLDAEIKKKKEEEERRRQQQVAATPRVQTAAPAPNFNTTTPAQSTVAPVNFEKPKQNFNDPTAPLNTSTPKRTFGNNSGATPGQIQMPEEFKTPQQKQLEATIAAKNARLNKDGTVIDNRPFPARVPNDQFAQANEALKQGATIQDVGNYWKSDADALRAELMKPNPDKARVQGLTQSINNRKAEITKMSTMMSKDEQDEFAKKAMESRGGKFQSNQNKVGDFLGAVVSAPFGIFTKPADDIAYMTNQSSFDTGLEDIDRRYRAGEITRARMEQEFKDLTGGMITPKHNGKAIKVTDQGLDYMNDGEEFAHFAGSVVQQGVDSYVGGGTGVKAALTGGKEVAELGIKEIMKDAVKQGLKESAVTGTLQTGADVLKGDGITPESLLMNYGIDAVLNTGGEATGKAVKKFVTDAKVKDATDRMNQALRANGTLDTMTETEVRQLMEKEATEQINTATKQVNEKRAATQAQQTPPDVLKPQDEQIPNLLETNVTEPPTKPRSTQSIADLLPGIVGRDPNAAKPQFTPADFGVEQSTYDRLVKRHGEQAAQNVLISNKDATNIRSQDAFVTAEARRIYGEPKTQRQIDTEMRQNAAKQEQYNVQQGTPTADELVAVDGKMVNTHTGEIVEDAPQPLMQEGGLIQQNSSLAPETVDVAQRPDLIPENAQAITSDGQPIVDSPIQTATDTMPQLGTMSEQFYKSRENQNISYEDMVKLQDNVVRQITDTAQKNGIDFQSVARRVQENEVNQVPYNQGLSDIETRLWDSTQAELNYMRARRGETAELSQNDRGQYYFPHQKADQTGSLTGGFTTGTPGNEMARKSVDDGGLGLDDIDYSPNVIGDYILRYADGKVLNEKRINQALDAAHPEVVPEIRSKAAKMIGSLQEDVNKLKKKISLGGAGKKAIISSDKPIDSAARLSEVGRTLGREQTIIAQEPKGLLNGDRINSVMIGDKPLGSVVGLNQYRDAATYAGTQVREADGDKDALIGLVTARLTNEYNIPAEDVDKAVNIIANMDDKMSDELKQARVTAIYTNAAKQQIMDTLQTLDIKSPKLRKDISDLTNQYLRAGSIESELSDKLVRGILKTTNALFRKLNVSSAINEMSDFTSFASTYGKNLTLIPDYSVLKSYNVGDIDPAVEPYLKQLNEGTPLKKVLRSINDATNLYRFVETYKAGVVINSAIKKHSGTLTGDALTKKVLQEYRDIALPRDEFTRTFLDDYPLWTQYMSWGVMNIGKEAKLARGKLEVGDLNDMSQKQRIARNLYANIPAKTVFWLASNGLKGTALMTAFGLTDFTGLTSQDYSGIAEEDKSLYDRTTQFTNQSAIMSLINSVVQGVEKEQLKEKYKDADYNPYEHTNAADTAIKTFTPQFIKNWTGADDLMSKGYSENAAGRVQYEAPTDPYNQIKAYLFGKNQTANAREYSGRENLVDRVQEGVNPIQAVGDMAAEQLGFKETQYNHPLTDKYSEAYKNAEKDGRTKMLEGGRQFNKYLDDMKKNSPDDYNRYIDTMNNNHVSPEYWKGIVGDKNDLTVFKTVGDRKKQLKKDLGIDYDPLYDLPDDQARSVLQLKSVPTGDDIALRNMLGKEGWYKDYKAKVSAYYDKAGEKTDSDFKETQRVKDWNALDDQLQSFYYDKTATEAPAWAAQYPLVYEAKKYEYGSPESKAFFKANYDAWSAQKEGYDKAQLAVINQMRKIEGFSEMGWEQYKQATNFADTDSDSNTSSKKRSYGYGSRGRGGGGGNDRPMGVKSASFGQSRAGGYSPVSSVKVKKNPRKARVRSGVKGGKIVVTSKKTL